MIWLSQGPSSNLARKGDAKNNRTNLGAAPLPLNFVLRVALMFMEQIKTLCSKVPVFVFCGDDCSLRQWAVTGLPCRVVSTLGARHSWTRPVCKTMDCRGQNFRPSSGETMDPGTSFAKQMARNVRCRARILHRSTPIAIHCAVVITCCIVFLATGTTEIPNKAHPNTADLSSLASHRIPLKLLDVALVCLLLG